MTHDTSVVLLAVNPPSLPSTSTSHYFVTKLTTTPPGRPKLPCSDVIVGLNLSPLGLPSAFSLAAVPYQVVEALPWERVEVLKWAAQGGVAVLLSPVTDRFVVSPAIHQWAQARLRSISK